jgi:membrane protease YdiL (CAAX protease family)
MVQPSASVRVFAAQRAAGQVLRSPAYLLEQMRYTPPPPGTSMALLPRLEGWRWPSLAVLGVTAAVVADRALRTVLSQRLGTWGWMVASTLLLGAVAVVCRRLRYPQLASARRASPWEWALGLAAVLAALQVVAAAALPPAPLPRSPYVALHLIALVPVVEELAFRGVIHDALRAHLRGSVATLASAAIFAAAHPLGAQALWAFGLGVVLAVAYDRTQSLAVPIVGHAAHNLAAYLVALSLVR